MVEIDTEGERTKLVWDFPIANTMPSRPRLFNLRERVVSRLDSDDSEDTSEDSSEDENKTQTEELPSSNEEVESLEEKVEEIQQVNEDTFGDFEPEIIDGEDFSASVESNEIEIEDGVAVPTVAEIQAGEEVTWINKDDKTRRITSIQGEQFTSDQLDQGDVFTHEFESEGATVYIDSISGGEAMSGAVLVGQAERPDDLPSETDGTPTPLGSGTDEDCRDTMSEAADDALKHANMGTGFN